MCFFILAHPKLLSRVFLYSCLLAIFSIGVGFFFLFFYSYREKFFQFQSHIYLSFILRIKHTFLPEMFSLIFCLITFKHSFRHLSNSALWLHIYFLIYSFFLSTLSYTRFFAPSIARFQFSNCSNHLNTRWSMMRSGNDTGDDRSATTVLGMKTTCLETANTDSK